MSDARPTSRRTGRQSSVAPLRDASGDVLTVNDLRVHYETRGGAVKAVDGVSFTLKPGERLGLVGESGSGKTTMALALMRLIKPPGRIVGGKVDLAGIDMLSLREERMRRVRLAEIAMVAQGAMNSLNPVMKVRDQIIDGWKDHAERMGRGALDDRIGELLRQVGLGEEVAGMYPHELSGGMKQRVVIAIAISLRPKVIIADEPTSALDVVVQRRIMETLGRVQAEIGAAVILIGHDMGLMAQFVDRLGVMYAGRLAELSPVEEIFDDPLHPYTRLLIRSLPSLDKKGEFRAIPGLPPSLLELPPGCPFHPRCPHVMTRCRTEEPILTGWRPNRWTACHLFDEERASSERSRTA
jgi:peptide/nickel transport system ATP-binding protein